MSFSFANFQTGCENFEMKSFALAFKYQSSLSFLDWQWQFIIVQKRLLFVKVLQPFGKR